jgi:hypothetical protein
MKVLFHRCIRLLCCLLPAEPSDLESVPAFQLVVQSLYFPKTQTVDTTAYPNVELMSQHLLSSLPYPLNQHISSLYFTFRRKQLRSSDTWSTIPDCLHGDYIQLHIRGLKSGLLGGSGNASDQCKSGNSSARGARPNVHSISLSALTRSSSGQSSSASLVNAATLPALPIADHMQDVAAPVTSDFHAAVSVSGISASECPVHNANASLLQNDFARLQSENQALKAEVARFRSLDRMEAAANSSAVSRQQDVQNKILAAIKMLQSCDIAVERPVSGASASASGSASEFNLKSRQSEQMVIWDVETDGFGHVSASR